MDIKEKRKLAYFMACSENIIFAAGNVALSINKYSTRKDYDIVIYHTGLRKSNSDALSRIPNVKLQYFQWPENFQTQILEKMPSGRWSNVNSLLAFAHFEIFDLLHEYETVIWLDVDISIQGSIDCLSNYGPFGQAYDLHKYGVWTVGDQFTQPLIDSKYNMEKNAYINACIVVNDSLQNWDSLTKYCYDKALKYAAFLKNCDQAIFSLMLQDFNINVKTIPAHKYICHANHEYASLAKLVHFGYHKKIWSEESYLRCFPEWFRTHIVWLSLGGDDFDRSNLSTVSLWAQLYGDFGKENYNNSNFLTSEKNVVSKVRNELFGLIPIYSLKSMKNEYKIKVLGMPFVEYRNTGNSEILYLFHSISLYKRCKDEVNQKERFYIFGILIFVKHKYKFTN